MRTEKQILASRANGAKSRGPVTPAGKAASSQNALKHGVLVSATVIKGERAENFLGMVVDLFDEFQPATPFEESLIETMAVARWRKERIWEILRATHELELDRQRDTRACPHPGHAEKLASAFKSLSDNSRTLDLLLRYETHYERQYLRAHKRFLECRAARLKDGPSPDLRTEPEKDPPPASAPAPAPAPPPVEPAPGPALQTVETAKGTQAPPPNGCPSTPPTPPESPDSCSSKLIPGPNQPFVVHRSEKYR